ncbi:MAG TPA: prolyl oligopeptidase family serine peptidase, partial [Propionibacteriaceae bacterium]|nr:prolyl oligopeptidase family serine peptidase [Propionibacteriaceae bacterium]
MTTTVAPHGSWASPISIASVLSAATGLSDLGSDGADAYWLESRPGQNGRLTLVRFSGGDLTELTPAPTNVRSRVMEYGGGAYDVRGGGAVICDDVTRSLLRLDPAGPVAITPTSAEVRFGDLRVHPERDLVLAVREDHRLDGEAVTTLVALELRGDNPDFGRILASGADFYANPELSGDQLAWIEWNHPDMPWDATVLKRATFVDGSLSDEREVMGGPDISVQHPRWTPDGRLVALSDESGFWNPRVADGPALSLDHDVDHPMWVLGNASMAHPSSDLALVSWFDDGRQVLGWWDLRENALTPIGEPVAGVDSIAASEGVAWAIVGLADRAQQVLRLVPGRAPEVVRTGSDDVPAPAFTSIPTSLWFDGRSGRTHAWLYSPTNADFTATEGERPPVIVKSHGGPTAFASGRYSPAVQYWTSRGFAVLDVNYSGSSGFGREYRERLKGRWGVAD